MTAFERASLADLTRALTDADEEVRYRAADALATVGDEAAGPALLARFRGEEPERRVRVMIAAALGAVKCREAIPDLIAELKGADDDLRHHSAWSLGELRAREALGALEDLMRESLPASTAHNVYKAIAQIRSAERG